MKKLYYTSPITNNRSSALRMKFRASEGFTLIEMIVSLAIFSIVAVVALGALMKIVSANKKAQSLMSAMTNINFALESMSRELRVGSAFDCVPGMTNARTAPAIGGPQGCESRNEPNGTVLAFKSSNTIKISGTPCNLTYAYIFVPNDGVWDIQKTTQDDGTITSCGDNVFKTPTSIIDPGVIITGYYVKVSWESYPLAAIRISGYVGAREKERTYFDVQTAVSARIPTENP